MRGRRTLVVLPSALYGNPGGLLLCASDTKVRSTDRSLHFTENTRGATAQGLAEFSESSRLSPHVSFEIFRGDFP